MRSWIHQLMDGFDHLLIKFSTIWSRKICFRSALFSPILDVDCGLCINSNYSSSPVHWPPPSCSTFIYCSQSSQFESLIWYFYCYWLVYLGWCNVWMVTPVKKIKCDWMMQTFFFSHLWIRKNKKKNNERTPFQKRVHFSFLNGILRIIVPSFPFNRSFLFFSSLSRALFYTIFRSLVFVPFSSLWSPHRHRFSRTHFFFSHFHFRLRTHWTNEA